MIEKYKKTKNENISEDFESLLIKEEAAIRKHFALNNKLKLENDTLKEKVRVFEEEQQKFEEKINKLKEDYENKIKDINKEIINLNIIKNEMQKTEKELLKKIENKQKEIYKLEMELNNLKNRNLKIKEESKENKILTVNNFQKNNSMDFGVKFRINYSDFDLLHKNAKADNSMIQPNSARNINSMKNIFDIKKISNTFRERNKFFNIMNYSYKSKNSYIKNENSIFNSFVVNNKNYNNQSVNDTSSGIRKIKNKFKLVDNNQSNMFNVTQYEKGENVIKKIKKNKILLLQRNDNNNKIKRNFSAVNKKDKNERYFVLFKKSNDNDIPNSQENNDNINLMNLTPIKNSMPNINDKKKVFKKINKFRLSSINKDENKNDLSFKNEDKKNQIFPKKILDDKNIQREKNTGNIMIDKYKGISINYNIPTN